MNGQLDSIQNNIVLMKQKHNLILSSPASDERKLCPSLLASRLLSFCSTIFAYLEGDKTELEQLMDQIKHTAGSLRTHLKRKFDIQVS